MVNPDNINNLLTGNLTNKLPGQIFPATILKIYRQLQKPTNTEIYQMGRMGVCCIWSFFQKSETKVELVICKTQGLGCLGFVLQMMKRPEEDLTHYMIYSSKLGGVEEHVRF